MDLCSWLDCYKDKIEAQSLHGPWSGDPSQSLLVLVCNKGQRTAAKMLTVPHVELASKLERVRTAVVGH